MTGSVSEVSSRSRLVACRAKPTKAKPKTTLFGSTMEKVDMEMIKKAEEVDLNELEESLKPKRQVRNPPPVLAAQIKDTSKMIAAREELEARKRDYKEATKALDQLEKHAFYNPGELTARIPCQHDQPIPDKPHQWMNARDLANASAINVLGVDLRKPTETYNRDKYEAKPPVHNYNLNGDPLQKGSPRQIRSERQMNAQRNKQTQIEPQVPVDHSMYVSDYHKHYNEKRKTSDAKRQEKFGLDLPRNIEHQFGTTICEQLLADKEKVNLTLEEQAKRRAYNRKRDSGQGLSLQTKEMKSTLYEDLGQALRLDHFAGFSTDNKSSTTKDNYTADVHKRHVPGPDKWRYQRDELSAWAECNVLRDRMKKAWDDYLVGLNKK